MGKTMIHPLNCKEVTTRLAFGDIDHYGWADRFMIRFHLGICWVCRKYERQMRMIGKAFQRAVVNSGMRNRTSDFKERLISRLNTH